jgi:hypothetical protein
MHWTLVAVAYNVVAMSGGGKSFRGKQRELRAAVRTAEWINHFRCPQ